MILHCHLNHHVFKRAVNWTPKSIPELIQNLHDIVKVQLIDMKRSLFGTGKRTFHVNPKRERFMSINCTFTMSWRFCISSGIDFGVQLTARLNTWWFMDSQLLFVHNLSCLSCRLGILTYSRRRSFVYRA
jgi:hypothetical protein